MLLRLPTDNNRLFSDPARFYMHTDRNFEGRRSKPWTGGKYGFTRNQKRISGGEVIFTRFHEGADIRPVRRDAAGEALDAVRATMAGEVVLANVNSRASSYGRYCVIRHDLGADGPVFSLYAHLANIAVKPNQRVRAGETIGRMGRTGPGLNRERSHLHFELNMMLHPDFSRWHDQRHKTPNAHGALNGINLAGLDVAALLRYGRSGGIRLPEFTALMRPHYRVRVRNTGKKFALLRLYPWLLRGAPAQPAPPSWEVDFSRSGVPLRVRPSRTPTSAPRVTWCAGAPGDQRWHTRSRLRGGSAPKLGPSGRSYAALVAGDF